MCFKNPFSKSFILKKNRDFFKNHTGNFSKKLKRANKINASYAIILGEEEINQNMIKFKDLSSGKEKLLNLDQAIKKITK